MQPSKTHLPRLVLSQHVCTRAQGRNSQLPRAVAYSTLTSSSFDEFILDQCDRKQVALNILSGLQRRFTYIFEPFRLHALRLGRSKETFVRTRRTLKAPRVNLISATKFLVDCPIRKQQAPKLLLRSATSPAKSPPCSSPCPNEECNGSKADPQSQDRVILHIFFLSEASWGGKPAIFRRGSHLGFKITTLFTKAYPPGYLIFGYARRRPVVPHPSNLIRPQQRQCAT
jgi:hypothetical protein